MSSRDINHTNTARMGDTQQIPNVPQRRYQIGARNLHAP